jgi:orotidine-5'-phosphate decarboxylase
VTSAALFWYLVPMNSFIEKVRLRWKASALCVGLDSNLSQLPQHLGQQPSALFEFNKAIIDATHDLVCAYKPQIAYYAAVGAEEQLKKTITYIHQKYPQIPVILDAKRGDIGDTAEMYAREAFEVYKADAVTVNPYMGGDTLQPFLKYKDKGIIILCKTSNAGSAELQNLKVGSQTLYQVVAQKAAGEWNTHKNTLLVVGGTHASELKEIRKVVGEEIIFLVPGVGAQGGSAKDVIQNGANSQGQGLIINSSRAIIYASSGQDFAEAARQAALKTIESFRF